MSFVNKEQAEFWSDRAATGMQIDERLETIIGLPDQLAIDRLRLRSGQRVVGLGCGAGRTIQRLSRAVLLMRGKA